MLDIYRKQKKRRSALMKLIKKKKS